MFIVVNEMEFSDWLQASLRERGISQAELARRSGLAPATVSMLITGRNQPKGDTCIALARGLGLPVETVLKAAGILPEPRIPESDPSTSQVAEIMKAMTAEERQEILAYVLWQFRRRRGG